VKVLSPGPDSYDAYGVFVPCVVFDGTTCHMWYTAFGSALCYATSADGLAWVKHGPARRMDAPGIWEQGGFLGACVVLDIATFRMWYSGKDPSEGKFQIGCATSPAPQTP
jgi:hypothetical protein